MPNSDRHNGQRRQLEYIVEIIKIVLECKKENGRNASTWGRTKKHDVDSNFYDKES